MNIQSVINKKNWKDKYIIISTVIIIFLIFSIIVLGFGLGFGLKNKNSNHLTYLTQKDASDKSLNYAKKHDEFTFNDINYKVINITVENDPNRISDYEYIISLEGGTMPSPPTGDEFNYLTLDITNIRIQIIQNWGFR